MSCLPHWSNHPLITWPTHCVPSDLLGQAGSSASSTTPDLLHKSPCNWAGRGCKWKWSYRCNELTMDSACIPLAKEGGDSVRIREISKWLLPGIWIEVYIQDRTPEKSDGGSKGEGESKPPNSSNSGNPLVVLEVNSDTEE